MFKSLALSGALAAGLVLSPLSVLSASAAPFTKSPGADAASGNLVLARQGRGGGGGMRGFSGGGRSFGGGGMRMRSFSGPRNFGGSRSFSRGAMGGGGIPRGIRGGDFGGNKFRPGGGWGKHGGHRHRHHRHRRFYGGGYYPYYGYGYGAAYYGDYYGSSDCGWLRRKAVRTGSSYWWRRYEQCVSDY